MGEVKRRRPWESDRASENEDVTGTGHVFLTQTLICALIVIGILIMKNVKNTEELCSKLRYEVVKQITVEDVTATVEDFKQILANEKK